MPSISITEVGNATKVITSINDLLEGDEDYCINEPFPFSGPKCKDFNIEFKIHPCNNRPASCIDKIFTSVKTVCCRNCHGYTQDPLTKPGRSTGQQKNNPMVVVYPNPVVDILGISTKNLTETDIIQVIATSIIGKTVYKGHFNSNGGYIDMSSWVNGIYVLTIKYQNTVINKKITKN